MLQKPCKYVAITAILSFMAMVLCSHGLAAQGNTFTPADSAFTMQVVREKSEIIITIVFHDSLVFEFASIEREADFDNNFSQCKYLRYEDVKAAGMKVRKKDNYPLPPNTDVQYRLKITMADGITRIFPPVLLPAFNNKNAIPPTTERSEKQP